jgi:hypothetical protein
MFESLESRFLAAAAPPLETGAIFPGAVVDAFTFEAITDDGRVSGSAIVAITIVAIAGDANMDGRVDIIDLGEVAASYGLVLPPLPDAWHAGDFNGDRRVDLVDLGILAANYGRTIWLTSSASRQLAVAVDLSAELARLDLPELIANFGLRIAD